MGKWSDQLNTAPAPPPEAEEMSWPEVIHSAMLNTPGSAYDFAANIVNAAIHPIETGKAMTNMAIGAVNKIPGAGYLTGPGYDVEGEKPRGAEFDAMAEFFSSRYGSVSGFKEAMAKDPVGVVADVSTVFTGAGGVARGAGKVAQMIPGAGKVAGAIEKTGAAMQKTGAIVDPLNIPKQATRALDIYSASRGGGTIAEYLYNSAAKWTQTSLKKKGRSKEQVRKAMTKNALDNKFMPTYAGIRKLRATMDKFDDKISELIQTSTQKGKMIPADEMLRHFRELEKAVWTIEGKGVSGVREIRKIKKEFQQVHGVYEFKIPGTTVKGISHPADRLQKMLNGGEIPKPPDGGKLIGYESLTPEMIQNKKLTIYKRLESSYSKITADPIGVSAQKALARGAKEIIREAIPEVAKINEKYGPLFDLYDAIDSSAGRISNYNVITADTAWKAAAGYAVSGGSGMGAAAGVIAGILEMPTIKAKLAIVIHHMRKSGINPTPTQLAKELGVATAFQGGRAGEELGIYKD